MNQYSGLSNVYDYLVSGVDFEGWIDYVEELIQHFGLQVKSIADIACGTGKTTMPFAQRGYRTYGVDISENMIEIARHNAEADHQNISFLVQDMRFFSLPEKVDLVTCFHDGLNYLTDIRDITQTFKAIALNLIDSGSIIFDLNTVKWLANSDQSINVVDEEDITLIWKTDYDQETDIWSINITGFVREGIHYSKFTEFHQEKAYTQTEIEASLKEAGFVLLGSFDAFKIIPAHDKSIRVFYVAHKIPVENNVT